LLPGVVDIPEARRGIPEGLDLADFDNSTAAKLYFDQLSFGENEERERRKSKVLVKAKDLKFEKTPVGRVAPVVDPKLGFYVQLMSTLVAEIDPEKHFGAHRYLYDERPSAFTSRPRGARRGSRTSDEKGSTHGTALSAAAR
jgi:hypothetical protein